ncbi:Ulp1 protease family, carboxy-terminal domain protein [Arachis hypogaea]|nr:Ulp1 protease family, carboxy-terminal domain protein [Arachis hypogaea]
MTTVVAIVKHILKSDIYKECKVEIKENMRRWKIYAPRGIPNRHQSRDSPSWVLQWMTLKHAFDSQCSGVHVLDENDTRMYTAKQLFHGRFNELKAEIAPLVQEFWSMHAEDDAY